jgi:hypothetical protein
VYVVRISHLVPGTPEEADKAHTHSQHLDRRRGGVKVHSDWAGQQATGPLCTHDTKACAHEQNHPEKTSPLAYPIHLTIT